MATRTEAVTTPDLFEVTIDQSTKRVPQVMLDWYIEQNATAKRNYPRTSEQQKPHIDVSHGAILSTATVALEQVSTDETTALIVGAGNCTDIPIKKLATMFKKVRLVDLDKDAMMAAVREIDPSLQEKIEIVQADISGITGDYARAILGSSVATS